MRVVREPLRLEFDGATRSDPRMVEQLLCRAARGICLDNWAPPDWLLEHQVDAARRIAGSLRVFGGALLADAVGLGKTYVSLAVSTRYRHPVATVPASLVTQWKRVARHLHPQIALVSHEALSRGQRIPSADLIIVDEAHRFRNSDTRRYNRLARGLDGAHLLLVTATPVVNRPQDLASLLRLFLPDNGLAVLGAPSIEQAVADREYTALAHAAAPLVVARTLRVLASEGLQVPKPTDGRVHRPPPLSTHDLEETVEAITKLGFPGTTDGRAVALLRGHLLHRLASSAAACRETLRRHLAYLDRAVAAFAQGKTIPRSVARHLLGPGDDLQLELGPLVLATPLPMPGREAFEKEQRNVLGLLDRLPRGEHPNPKADHLSQILAERAERRTIVFVTAVSTALDLARRLRWRRLAVVGGGLAWISSGRMSVDKALGLFAPRSRRAAEPSRATRVTTLIATDLVSEGLNLQDADGIVHYDLPWTPLRLAQRLGRIARLGSVHPSAHVYWFEPPPSLERWLRTGERLGDKSHQQLELGVAVTSTIGRAQVMNTTFEYRECLGHSALCKKSEDARTSLAVVRGVSGMLLAVEWHLPRGTCRELVTISGDPPRHIRDYRATDALRRSLCQSPANITSPSELHLQEAFALLRYRLRAACGGPKDGDTARLKRIVLDYARSAGRQRDGARIELLDGILERLSAGLAAGPMRELAQLLDTKTHNRALRLWLVRNSPTPVGVPVCRIEAVLCGDGLGLECSQTFRE